MTLNAFVTARLRGEPMDLAHEPDMLRMHAHPAVMAGLGGLRDAAETRAYVERNRAHWRRYGFGIWVLRDPATDQVIGRGGLRHLDVEGSDEVELGYAFFPEHWGRGLATELALACCALAREQLRLTALVAVTLPDNAASQRVLTRAGFVYERDVVHSASPLTLYRRLFVPPP